MKESKLFIEWDNTFDYWKYIRIEKYLSEKVNELTKLKSGKQDYMRKQQWGEGQGRSR